MRFERPLGEEVLAVDCDPDLTEPAARMLDALTEMHNKGPAVQDGTTIMFGWVLLKIKKTDDTLTVWEPDFYGNSIGTYIPTVNSTLNVLRDQHRLVNKLHCTPKSTFYKDTVVLEKNCLRHPYVYLERQPAVKKGDSGWFVGYKDRRDAQEVTYETIYAGQLVFLRAELMQVLSLPVRYIALFNGRFLQAVLDDANNQVWP